MLIAIGALVLVVVFLANKTTPSDQADATKLPDPPSIPATGTSGVLSPAMHPGAHEFGTPLLGTNAGQLIGQTNATAPQQPWRGNPPLPGTAVKSAPQSAPLLSKELFTGVRSMSAVRPGSAVPTGWQKL